MRAFDQVFLRSSYLPFRFDHRSSEQALKMTNLIVSQAEARASFYDPRNCLDRAIVDKMVVLG
jgi:hypothetical protein